MRRFYQVDFRDLLTRPRKITRRQVIVWMRHLPSDSALARRGWAGDVKPSLSEEIQAAGVNEQRVLRWLYTTTHSKKKPEMPPMIELSPKEDDGA